MAVTVRRNRLRLGRSCIGHQACAASTSFHTPAKLSDKLVGLVVPEVQAAAVTCSEARNSCDGACPFWFWRRAHYIICTNGQLDRVRVLRLLTCTQ